MEQKRHLMLDQLLDFTRDGIKKPKHNTIYINVHIL
uniref:Uncharacterized protein n=1 Tax=Rhizophora mucronata TaxID=61149 RepID=A0A2P2KPP5_RHIMU